MDSKQEERTIVLLLTGQLFFFALALSLLEIASSSVFLIQFGAESLSYVYIAIALFVSLYSAIYVWLQRQFSLLQLSTATMMVFGLLLAASAIGLAQPGTGWIAFALLVVHRLGYQMAFIIVGGQAGSLLNVRQMKRLFPRIASGFTFGFLASGLILPPLRLLLPNTEQLLFAGAVSMLLAMVLLRVTNKRFSAESTKAAPKATITKTKARSKAETPSLGQLLKKRFVSQLFIYQMLSAIGTQLVLFIFLDYAESTYRDVDSLAQFFGNFAIVLNTVLLLFLARPASYILSRFGLGVGLAMNPFVVGLLVLGITVTGLLPTTAALALFLLAAAARIADIALSVGTTSPAIKAGYQALPAPEQAITETTVEGIGVPLAFGVTGVLLLVFNALPWFTSTHLILFTLFVSVIWAIASYYLYRGYQQALRLSLQRQTIDPVTLNLDDGATLAVIAQLVESDDEREVNLALNALASDDHPSLDLYLLKLLDSADGKRAIGLLHRVADRRVLSASDHVQKLMASDSAETRGAAIYTWCALHESKANDAVAPYLVAESHDVQYGALVGLLRFGGIVGVELATQRMQQLMVSDSAERQLVAQVVGAVGASSFYQPLKTYLRDDVLTVRLAALEAAAVLKHIRLIPLLIVNLMHAATRSGATNALEQYDSTLLPYLEAALNEPDKLGVDSVKRLTRIVGQQRGAEPFELLIKHIDHPNSQLRGQILSALINVVGDEDVRLSSETVLQQLECEAQKAYQLLVAQANCNLDASSSLHSAFQDELMEARMRLFSLAALLDDSHVVLRAADQLKNSSRAKQALAFELLDVSLSGRVKQLVLPLVDPTLTGEQRMAQLSKEFSAETLSRDEQLQQIATNANAHYLVWTQACAVHEIGRTQLHTLKTTVRNAVRHPDPIVTETANWALHVLSSEEYESL